MPFPLSLTQLRKWIRNYYAQQEANGGTAPIAAPLPAGSKRPQSASQRKSGGDHAHHGKLSPSARGSSKQQRVSSSPPAPNARAAPKRAAAQRMPSFIEMEGDDEVSDESDSDGDASEAEEEEVVESGEEEAEEEDDGVMEEEEAPRMVVGGLKRRRGAAPQPSSRGARGAHRQQALNPLAFDAFTESDCLPLYALDQQEEGRPYADDGQTSDHSFVSLDGYARAARA